jgi:uncharacterized membrane protein YkoI
MRSLLVGLALLGALSNARAEIAIYAQPCLSAREMQEVVSTERVLAPALAVAAARRAVPNAEMLRANMCRDRDVLIYVISVLRKDGRVVHVVIDARSGKVADVK